MYRYFSKRSLACLILYMVPLAAGAQSVEDETQLSATEQLLSAQPTFDSLQFQPQFQSPLQPPSQPRSQFQSQAWSAAQQSAPPGTSGFGVQIAGQGHAPTKTPPVPQQQVGTHKQTIQLPPVGGRNLNLPRTGFSTLSNRGGGLPPTRLDSFVFEAGGSAELIYGDEGTYGPPPYFGFSSPHHIEAGIHSGGLTTGHRSGLPEAWGYPE